MKRVFENLKERFGKSGPLALNLLVLIFEISILAYLLNQKRYFLKEASNFSDAAPSKKVCQLAMLTILNKNASPQLIDKKQIEEIEENNYSGLDFVGGEKIEDILVKENGDRCNLILTDRLGHRYFLFHLKNSEDSYHVYGKYVESIEEITKNEARKEAHL